MAVVVNGDEGREEAGNGHRVRSVFQDVYIRVYVGGRVVVWRVQGQGANRREGKQGTEEVNIC